MKKSGIFLLAAVLSLPVWAGKLDDDCRKVRAWINANPNQVSRRLYIRDLNKIINSAQSEAQKIEALQNKFPYAFLPAWQKDLDAAKAQGVKFSDDNKTLIKCPENVTSVVIPSCVTTIGKDAFYRCENLTSVTIPNSVTTIGKWAFAWCVNLRSVTIPDSVTTIGNGAFGGCENLTSVTIPNSVTTIGDSAFSLCENLRSVTIPASVTIIGKEAFHGCFNLTSVTIPASVTTIGDAVFSCVKSVKVADDNPAFMVDDAGALIDIENKKLLYLPQSYQGSYVIPDGITTIGDMAFSGCSKLTSVTIPDSVTEIGEQAFDSCVNLMNVTIPASVTTIGNDAFYNCSKLTSVTIPASVTTIGKLAFFGCKNLTSVTIPANAEYTEGFFASFPKNCKVIRRK